MTFLGPLPSLLLDGISYGVLLFLFSVGLSVTLGLMRYINLAHGAFAMGGGYLAAVLTERHEWPFLATLPCAFLAAGIVGAVLERVVVRFVYNTSPLEQVLFSIGMTFAAIALATLAFGSQQQAVRLPAWFLDRVGPSGFDTTAYRAFLIVLGAIAALALHALFTRTRFGAQVRAAVDNRRAAEGMGISVALLFSVVFALGSGLAGLGGALAVAVIGLDPSFPLKYVTYFLMVVAIGGAGSIGGSLAASVLLGVADVVLKYYIPESSPFVIYLILVGTLLAFPAGLRGRTA